MIRGREADTFFPLLSDEQVRSLSRFGEQKSVRAGDYLFKGHDHVDSFFVILEGEIQILRVAADGSEEAIGTHGPANFTGQLSSVAGRTPRAHARAVAPTRVLEITSEGFRKVSAEHPEIADLFISTLARRMRYTQAWLRQQVKLAALGKLSAGLAHELNNPASAARRASAALRDASLRAQLLSLEHDGRFSPAQRSSLSRLRCEAGGGAGAPLDPLSRSEREDELGAWLNDRGIEDAWNLAPTLAAADLGVGELEALADELGDDDALAGGLEWLGTTLDVVHLTEEVGLSVARISELVGAMKEYSYMDRAAYAETDVRAGLESTLSILGHKLEGVSVEREYDPDLPAVWANAGELNQVWTNLIDNAAQAVSGRGRLGVVARGAGDHVEVEVFDDGPGVPREIRDRIFEPFFTTRGVGEGIGLGLDTVRRVVAAHGGEVSFESRPGETRFFVRLPARGGPEGGAW